MPDDDEQPQEAYEEESKENEEAEKQQRFEQLKGLRTRLLQLHNEGEEKDLLNSALLDSVNSIYSENLAAVSLVSLRIEAKHLQVQIE